MGQATKKDGRIVANLATTADWDASQAEAALIKVLSSVDPWDHVMATERALLHLRKARTDLQGIIEICLLARQRGEYQKKELL